MQGFIFYFIGWKIFQDLYGGLIELKIQGWVTDRSYWENEVDSFRKELFKAWNKKREGKIYLAYQIFLGSFDGSFQNNFLFIKG